MHLNGQLDFKEGILFQRSGRRDVCRCPDEIDKLRIRRILVVLTETLLDHGLSAGRATD